MKTLSLLTALLLVAGCKSQSALQEIKTYIASTPQAEVDASHFASIMSKVCRGDDFIPFLKQKATGDDPRDAVAAYVVLTELVAQARIHPTADSKRLAEVINPKELASEFSQVDVSGLKGNWIEWITLANRIMTENLEQDESTVPSEVAHGASSDVR